MTSATLESTGRETAAPSRSHAESRGKAAVVYRMVTPEHLCPFGLKSRWLLNRNGHQAADNLLTHRAERDAFKRKHDVKTTPPTFVDGEHVGGYDDLRKHFGLAVEDPDATSCQPVIALAVSWATLGTLFTGITLR